MLFAPVAASSGHLFLDAAIFQEILLVLFQQPPQQEICLMNQHQRNVGKSDVVAQFADAHIIGWRGMLLAPLTGVLALLAVYIPHLIAMIAQIGKLTFIYLLHYLFCLLEDVDDALVVHDVFEAEGHAFAVFKPFLGVNPTPFQSKLPKYLLLQYPNLQ